MSLFLMVDVKEFFWGWISLILKLAFCIIISVLLSKALDLESSETNANWSRSSTFNFIILLSLITIGRTFKLCGAIGVMIKFCLLPIRFDSVLLWMLNY